MFIEANIKSIVANVGQEGIFGTCPSSLSLSTKSDIEDFDAAIDKAKKIGALKVYVEDLRKEFVEELCFPAIQCNAVYEGVYLLGKSQLETSRHN